MFLFKKKKNIKLHNKFINFFYYFGLFSFIISILLILYLAPFFKYGIETFYISKDKESSNTIFVSKTFLGKTLEKVIGPPYFSVNSLPKIYDFTKRFIITNLSPEKKLDTIELNINYKNLEILDGQRKNLENYSEDNKWAKGNIVFISNSKKKKLKIKLKAKGDRNIHRRNLNEMSFKIDIIGEKRIYGIEEFSLQKPIVRNYSLEIIASKIMLENDILAPKTIPVKLYLNGENLGIFHIEESFSKEILETNKRKNGPIFGIEDELSNFFPDITYKLYSENFWMNNDPKLIKSALSKLEYIKNNFNNPDFDIFQYFDEDKWSTFYALSDVLAAHHGSKGDSVKYYYNSSTGKFEPIFFDGHINNGLSKLNIILADFLYDKPDNIENMGYLNNYKSWYQLFFNQSNQNSNFLYLYLKKLDIFSSGNFQNKINKTVEKIDYINSIYYSNFMPADGVWSKSLLPFYYSSDFFAKRAKFIKAKIKALLIGEELISFKKPNVFQLRKKINDNNIFQNDKIDLVKDVYYLDNINIINKKINFLNHSIIILTGNNKIENTNLYGEGMIVQNSGKLEINKSKFFNLKNINQESVNWSGAINIINSEIYFNDVYIEGAIAEDSINIVNSKGSINSLSINNSLSDALDIDFGTINFDKINCYNIGNDCLDVSGSSITGNTLLGNNVKDKVLSTGEFSIVKIKNLISENSEIGIVAKDASDVVIENALFIKTKLFAAVFKKKKVYLGKTSLKITNEISADIKNFNDLLLTSRNSQLKIADKNYSSNFSSKKIESLMYGNQYGAKTAR